MIAVVGVQASVCALAGSRARLHSLPSRFVSESIDHDCDLGVAFVNFAVFVVGNLRTTKHSKSTKETKNHRDTEVTETRITVVSI